MRRGGRRCARPGLGDLDPDGRAGTLRTFVTDDPVRFKKLAARFLGVEIDLPTWVAPEELYGVSGAAAEPVRISVPA